MSSSPRHEDASMISVPAPQNSNLSVALNAKPEAAAPGACRATGAAICLCDSFNKAALRASSGDKLDLGNGVTAKVTEVENKETGKKEIRLTVQDGDQDIVSGTGTQIQDFFRQNNEKIGDELARRFGNLPQRESLPPADNLPPRPQPIMKVFDDAIKAGDNTGKNGISPVMDNDLEVDFGEDLPSASSIATPFSPR